MDERTIFHRYKATRWAVFAGLLVMGAIFEYQFFKYKEIRWDLMVIMGVMAVVKVAARFYYKYTN